MSDTPEPVLSTSESHFSPLSATACPEQSIQEAELLLSYAAQKGLKLEKQTVQTIVEAKHAQNMQNWNSDIETRFWLDFNALARTVEPASISSLKATHPIPEPRPSNFYGGFLGILRKRFLPPYSNSLAQKTVSSYQFFTLIALAVLMIVQFYSITGSNIIDGIVNIYPQEIEALENKRLTLLRETPQEELAEHKEFNEIYAKLVEVNIRIEANHEMLKQWNFIWRYLGFSALENSLKSADELPDLEKELQYQIIHLQEAQFGLQALQLYILPLLYGLLGAFVYVLRTLTIEIRNLTYEVESNIRYRLRIQLGALAGLAIGWFTDPGGPVTISALSLAPLALAFLTGYSVEVFFSIMDRLIYTLSAGDTPNPTNEKLKSKA